MGIVSASFTHLDSLSWSRLERDVKLNGRAQRISINFYSGTRACYCGMFGQTYRWFHFQSIFNQSEQFQRGVGIAYFITST